MRTSKLLLSLLTLLFCTAIQAQNSFLEKYSKYGNATFVYISSTMLEMQPNQYRQVGDVNISNVMKQLDGIYVISTGISAAQKELMDDVEILVKKGKYELLMRQKGMTNYGSSTYIKRQGKELISDLIMITTTGNNTLLKIVILTGKMTLKDLQSITTRGYNPASSTTTNKSIPGINASRIAAETPLTKLNRYLRIYPRERQKLDSINRVNPRALDHMRKDVPQLDSLLNSFYPYRK